MTDMDRIQWPGWSVVRLIGRGSFGAVYEIRRELFGVRERAALKHIRIPRSKADIQALYNDGYDEESITAAFESRLQGIVAEYALMRKLNGSTNVVNCDDFRVIEDRNEIGWDIYIKMELLTPLTETLKNPIPPETAVKLGIDLCTALSLCEANSIVHRDIKPQNIFVSARGDYKLGDFGIAKTIEKTMGGTKTGTYKYMAPEVYNNRPYGHSADIYSLGLVLYWMLNRKRMPFMPLPPEKLKAGMDEQARNRRLSGEALPPPADGSPELQRIVLKACAYDPADRYRTAEELLADLHALRQGDRRRKAAPKPEPAAAAPKPGDGEETVGLARPRSAPAIVPAPPEPPTPPEAEATAAELPPPAETREAELPPPAEISDAELPTPPTEISDAELLRELSALLDDELPEPESSAPEPSEVPEDRAPSAPETRAPEAAAPAEGEAAAEPAAEEAAEAEAPDRRKKALPILLAAGLLIGAVILLLLLLPGSSGSGESSLPPQGTESLAPQATDARSLDDRYQQALGLLETGDVEAARELFRALGNYRDAELYAKVFCDHLLMVELFNNLDGDGLSAAMCEFADRFRKDRQWSGDCLTVQPTQQKAPLETDGKTIETIKYLYSGEDPSLAFWYFNPEFRSILELSLDGYSVKYSIEDSFMYFSFHKLQPDETFFTFTVDFDGNVNSWAFYRPDGEILKEKLYF